MPIDLLYSEEMVREMFMKEAGGSGDKSLGSKALELYMRGHLYRQFNQPHVSIVPPIRESLPPKPASRSPHVEKVASLLRNAERPALVIDPATGRFKLYSCTDRGSGWTVIKFDDVDDPAGFDPATARTVLAADAPEDDVIRVRGHKDPVTYHDGAQWHMFTIGIDRVERIHHFLSDDGEAWRVGLPAPVMDHLGAVFDDDNVARWGAFIAGTGLLALPEGRGMLARSHDERDPWIR